MSKLCLHCKTNNKDAASYCVNCGKLLDRDEKVVVSKSKYDDLEYENSKLDQIAYSREWKADRYGWAREVRSKSYKELFDEEAKRNRKIQWVTYPTIALLLLGGLIFYFYMKSDLDYYEFSNRNNLSEANKWYLIAAKYGVANASEELAVWGDTIILNNLDFYKKTANEGNMFAMYTVGKILEDSIQEKKDVISSWYKCAADWGHATAQRWMALSVESDSEKVIWLEKAANQGNAEAQNEFGNKYYWGQGVKCNYEEAFRWYKKSAELGFERGQRNLGFMYRYGLGVAKDTTEAIAWFMKAADQNNSSAMSALGELYRYKKAYGEALSWFKKAAANNYAPANRNIAFLYRYGYGVVKDYKEMIVWYKKAAELGDMESQCDMGQIYYEGICDNEKNWTEAVKWYKMAAEKNNWAAYHLGEIYEIGGYGVRKDIKEAIKWYELSASQGSYSAKSKLNKLK